MTSLGKIVKFFNLLFLALIHREVCLRSKLLPIVNVCNFKLAHLLKRLSKGTRKSCRQNKMVELVRLVITKINNRGKTEQSRKIKMEENELLRRKIQKNKICSDMYFVFNKTVERYVTREGDYIFLFPIVSNSIT